MRNLKYTTFESVQLNVNGYNLLNQYTDEILTKVRAIFNENIVGKKIKAVSTNSLTKEFKNKIETYYRDNDKGYKIFWDGDYLHLEVTYRIFNNLRHDFKNEILICVADNNGVCKRVLDTPTPFREQKEVSEQWEKVQRIVELQKELETLEYQIISNIRY